VENAAPEIAAFAGVENMRVEMNAVARIRIGLNIRRPKKKSNVLQDKPIIYRVFHDLMAVHCIQSAVSVSSEFGRSFLQTEV